MQNSAPETVKHNLEKCGATVDLVRFDFQEMCKSLLTHPRIANKENFAFPDPNNPYVKPPTWEQVEANPDSHILSDLHQGRWFIQTHHMKCVVENRDVLLPIIIFIDKTHTDAIGRLKQEPVLFTLGIFSLRARMNPLCWRPLGYIPNLENVSTWKDAKDKLSDYHSMLSVILEPLVKTQRAGGFKWDLKLGTQVFPCVFRCEVAYFCGDNEGANKICGRYGSNTNIKNLCRVCTCPLEKISSTHRPEHPEITREMVKNLKNKEDEQALSHYNIKNATDDLSFGAYQVWGCHRCSPSDHLHTRRIGTQKRLVECCLECKCINARHMITKIMDDRRRRATTEQSAGTGGGKTNKSSADSVLKFDDDGNDKLDKNGNPVEPPPPDKELYLVVTEKLNLEDEAKMKVFSPGFCARVETMAKYWGKTLQHQSDRSLGRTFFPNGITSNTKIAGHTRPGVLVLFLLVFVSSFGASHFETANTKKE